MTLTEFEIGRILHLKSEIRNRRLDCASQLEPVQFAVSDFGFEVQIRPISNSVNVT